MNSVNAAYVISSSKISVELSGRGEITAVIFGNKKLRGNITGRTHLAETSECGQVTSRTLTGGGAAFIRKLSVETEQCNLTERFTPTENSIRWEIEIQGLTEPWSTEIATQLTWPDAQNARFWTTWGDRRYSHAFPDKQSTDVSWCDPLETEPFREYCLDYGGHYYAGGGFSLPLATVMEEAEDLGFSLILSPEDTLLGLRLKVDESGRIGFSRYHHRISRDQPVRFAMDLVVHEADWRPGLAWAVQRYPRFFHPPNPRTYNVAGGGAYSQHEGELDVEKLRKMGFRVNWKASFDFPYIGMFLPPTQSDEEQWKRFGGQQTSIAEMRDYARRMKEMGFEVLSYFNTSEFGTEIAFPPADGVVRPDAQSDPDLWKDPSAFLYNKLADAMLYGTDGRAFRSWRSCAVLDSAEPVYREYLLDQARRHIEKVPDSCGICIDRLDWSLKFNRRRDDGVSWLSRDTVDEAGEKPAIGWDREKTDSPVCNGQPARSLLRSWIDLMRKLGPLMHQAGKVVYFNPHIDRIEMAEHVDGIFDEMAHFGYNLNLASFLGLFKPVICWADKNTDITDSPDAFFQRHLHMGAFPLIPFPGNEHCVGAEEEVERYYLQYGPLINALRGRKWVLQPHAVTVKGSRAKVNLFSVPDGYILPVTFGDKNDRVDIMIRNPQNVLFGRECIFEAIHPGGETWIPVDSRRTTEGVILGVPLYKGCAMVRILKERNIV